MLWKVLADIALALHFLWVGAIVLGPLWAWRRPLVRFAHLLLLWITAGIELSGYYCPLTIVETVLRYHYDPATVYSDGLLAHYLNRLTLWDVNGRCIGLAGVGWTLLWTVIYALLWARRPSGGIRKS